MNKTIRPTLDRWIGGKIGLSDGFLPKRGDIERYQLERLNAVFAQAYAHSRFHKERFGRVKLDRLEDMSALPFTNSQDLQENALQMLCVSLGEVNRIVTLSTSGSSGRPKRVYFTDSDIELCLDFFHHGMQNLVDSSDRVAVFFPASSPDSVGDILIRGLRRIPAEAYALHGTGIKPLPEFFKRNRITSLAGTPDTIAEIAGKCGREKQELHIKSVLLSADYVSDAHRETIKSAWDCEVFEHYGITEAGLGFAVSCQEQMGYHVREADLFVEIIEPESGMPVPEGARGEIVFTTLTREAMPFIRYRTGDMSRFIPGKCPCGTVLRLLGKIEDRGLKKGGANR